MNRQILFALALLVPAFGLLPGPVLSEAEDPAEFFEFDDPPQVVTQEAPVYPSTSRKAGHEGKVMVEVIIDTEGEVVNVRSILVESRRPPFEEEVLLKETVGEWVFAQDEDQDGRRVSVVFQLHPRNTGERRQAKVELTEAPERVRGSFPKRIDSRLEEKTLIVIGADVDEEGRVVETWFEDPLNMRDLKAAALEAAAQWRFTPARREGTPVKAKIVIPFEFALQ